MRECSPRVVLRGNNFRASADYHVKLGEAQPEDVDARGNWWGHSTGPYHPTKNPQGQGVRVSDYVNFDN